MALLSSLSVAFGFAASFHPVRGDGLFLDPVKLVAVLLMYVAWLATAAWMDRDIQKVELKRERWNLLFLSLGGIGLAAIWYVPNFVFAFSILLALYSSVSLIYVGKRNALVPKEARVLTRRHFQKLWRSLFGKPAQEKEEGQLVPVRFIGKSSSGAKMEDPERVARAEASPGYRLALELVYEAVTHRATDIHLEPTREEMTVRFRIDSMLQQMAPFSRHRGDAVLNIFKVLANLDISEKRKAQDGGFAAEVEGRLVDFRVATAGSVAGEKMVMRLLDSAQNFTSLAQVGMKRRLQAKIEEICAMPHGMLIVCGPTGAGKTSTLYACLNAIDRYQRNVITLENPVEYTIENVTQIEVNPKAGKTFASELRSILRQDPDVILIGEVRDAETAEIACQAAQTGHLVFTTLHANDTVTAIGRLLDLGVQPYMIASSLTAILGQRLIRLLCPHCKVPYQLPAEVVQKLRIRADKVPQYFYREPTAGDKGNDAEECSRCRGVGYLGRTGIFELLLVTDEIRDLIRANPDLSALRKAAQKAGLVTLFDDGLRQVVKGKTSLAELQRVAK